MLNVSPLYINKGIWEERKATSLSHARSCDIWRLHTQTASSSRKPAAASPNCGKKSEAISWLYFCPNNLWKEKRVSCENTVLLKPSEPARDYGAVSHGQSPSLAACTWLLGKDDKGGQWHSWASRHFACEVWHRWIVMFLRDLLLTQAGKDS